MKSACPDLSACRSSRRSLRGASYGFTIIEMLITISLLVILFGATLMMINPVAQLRKSRDSQRKSDLNQYRTALEAYSVANNGFYTRRPGRQTASVRPCDKLEPTFMSDCPNDPGHNPGDSPNNNYRYRTNGTGCLAGEPCATQYVLWTYLETGGVWEVCSGGLVGKLEYDPPDVPSDSSGNCQVSL